MGLLCCSKPPHNHRLTAGRNKGGKGGEGGVCPPEMPEFNTAAPASPPSPPFFGRSGVGTSLTSPHKEEFIS